MHTASTTTSVGNTTANSAVTLPRWSPRRQLTRERKRISHHVGQHASNLITPKNNDEETSEPDRCHSGNGVFCGGGTPIRSKAKFSATWQVCVMPARSLAIGHVRHLNFLSNADHAVVLKLLTAA
jgi:hypothetical protein